MSTSGSGGAFGPRVRALFERAASADNYGEIIFSGLGAISLAFGSAISAGILTVADVFIVPAQALIRGLGELVGSLFGGAATIIDFGALASAISIGPEGLFASPLSFAVGIGIILLGLYLIAQFREEPETGNLIPGLPADIPFIGSEEEGEDNNL